ncbi:hypothetical protein ACVDG5_018585 [Mesorhizobium sp. ORM6]
MDQAARHAEALGYLGQGHTMETFLGKDVERHLLHVLAPYVANSCFHPVLWSMIPKSGIRASEKITLKQRDRASSQLHQDATGSRPLTARARGDSQGRLCRRPINWQAAKKLAYESTFY